MVGCTIEPAIDDEMTKDFDASIEASCNRCKDDFAGIRLERQLASSNVALAPPHLLLPRKHNGNWRKQKPRIQGTDCPTSCTRFVLDDAEPW